MSRDIGGYLYDSSAVKEKHNLVAWLSPQGYVIFFSGPPGDQAQS